MEDEKIDIEFAKQFVQFNQQHKQDFVSSLSTEQEIKLAFAVENLFTELRKQNPLKYKIPNKQLILVYGKCRHGKIVDFTNYYH